MAIKGFTQIIINLGLPFLSKLCILLPEQTRQLIPGFLLKTEQSHDTPQSKSSQTALSTLRMAWGQLSGPLNSADVGTADPKYPSASDLPQATRTPSIKAVQPGG